MHVLPPDYKTRLRWIVPLLIVIAIVFPFFANKYLLTVVILGLIYVSCFRPWAEHRRGWAGLLDLGYVAFYAIGAGLALGYQYPKRGSGRCCHWRRLRQPWPGAFSGSRCCECTAITWPS